MPLSNPQDCKGSSHDTNHLKDHQSFQMDTKTSSALKSNFNGREVGTAGRTVVPSRPFPFQPTPSGNLKIIPNQVVYESKKVSVLVANPKKTKINVTKESDWHCSPNLDMNQMIKCCQRKEIDYGMFPEPHNVMQDNSLPPPHDEPVGVISQGELCQVREGPGGEGLIREESESFTKASDDESEAGLRRFFSPSDNEIEWNKLNLPAKTHMLKLLAERIANYVNPDIIVCVGNDQFNCHHLVLQCYSSFFDRECDKMVELPSNKVSSRAFSLIYDWMIYSGQDSYILLRRDNILEIFIAAQFLGIKELEEQCWAFIDSPVLFSEATAFMLYLDARKRNNMEVAQLMIPRVTSFFLPLVASRDFLQLPVEDVCTFLSSNYIQISCEMQVFMTAVRWLMYDWSSRACHLVEVMRCVRFGWIVPWQLVDIRRNPVNPEFIQVTSHPEIMQMVDDGVAFAIVHYWYGKAKEDECYEWVKALDLKVPHQRNWDTKKQEYGTYQEFLDELDSIRKSMEKKRRQLKRMHRMNTNEQISGQSTIVQSSKPLGGNTRAILENPRNLNNGGIQRTLVRDGGLQRGDELSGNESENMCRKNAENNEPMLGHSGFQSEYLKNSNEKAATWTKCTTKANSESKLYTKLCVLPKFFKEERELNTACSCPVFQNTKPMIEEMRLSVNHCCLFEGRENLDVQHACKKRDGPSQNQLWKMFHKAAQVIQRAYKRYTLMKKWMEVVSEAMRIAEEQRMKKMNDSAMIIQSWWRKFMAQKQLRKSNYQRKKSKLLSKRRRKVQRSHLSIEKKQHFSRTRVILHSIQHYLSTGSLFFHDWEAVLVIGGTTPPLSSQLHYSVGQVKTYQDQLKQNRVEYTGNDGNEIIRYNPGVNEWEKMKVTLPEGRHHHACAFLGGLVYVVGIIGGCNAKEEAASMRKTNVSKNLRCGAVVGTTWALNPVTGCWKQLPPLTIPRRDLVLIGIKGSLYAIGGMDRNGIFLSSVEHYNPRKARWTFVAPMPEPRVGHAGAKHHDLIWIAGGTLPHNPAGRSASHSSITFQSHTAISDAVFVYDPRDDVWSSFASLRFPRTYSSLFSINNYLFLVGGVTRLHGITVVGLPMDPDRVNSMVQGEMKSVGSVDVLDGREWKLQAELAVPRHGHSLSYLGTQLVIIGGMSTATACALNRVECFCSERKRWLSNVAFLPKPVIGQAAIALPPATLM